jgi:isoleucyl-tRNA synthetase
MSDKKFQTPDVKSLYNDVETPILEFWKQNEIFEKSISQREGRERFVFYDGPPFVTGTPHYGHLLSSILKDIIPRYQTMLGKQVERVWGWDCHGLPVEEKVERTLGTKNRKDIENKVGVKTFIESCFSYVKDTSAEWPWYIDRIARWVDMDNAYRTMDKNYMETVMWVFKQLYDKDLVYKGKRVSLYCTRCGTPISNFEVAMDNSYADREDPSVYVKFPLKYYKTGLGVGIVISNEQGQILMMKRNEPGRDQVWGIVGGKLDPEDKNIDDTIVREMKEEIGIEPKEFNIHGYAIDVFEGRLFKTYHATAIVDKEPQPPASDVATELKWFDIEDLPWEDMHIPTKNTLKDILENKPSGEEYSPEKPNVYAVAWTTTPWTLPENAALAIDEKKTYVTVQPAGSNDYFIVAKDRVADVFKDQEYVIIDEYEGRHLIKLSYEPLFTYFPANENDHKIYAAEFVSMEDGSGIVHIAPGFGEDDTELGKKNGLSMYEGVDEEGKMIEAITDFAGIYLKDADPKIIENLENRGLMLKAEKIVHSYPLCYRCQTPLIYKAQDSWYIDIGKIRPQLEANNENITWVPDHIKNGRFLAGLKSAPDWGISRTRYWATPMPVWECDSCDHRVVLGSIAEIEKRSGKTVTDLHRPYIDEHTFPCEKCSGTMVRIPEVVDCWLESGSMPYAQLHYPFENKEKFEQTFPGDYIVEYVAQTRAWFYVMHVLSTALFGTNAFKNVICTGTIKGTDGRKMSKSFGNYPDPRGVLEHYGGDALRLYLADSVLPVGEDMNVSEEAIASQTKDVLLPLLNVYKYFALYANQHNFTPDYEHVSVNPLDQWILARVTETTINVKKSLDSYLVQKATGEIKPLIDDISTWYIRRSRERFVAGDKDALNTLFMVIYMTTTIFAPIIPFTTEFIYQNLRKAVDNGTMKESIHLELINEVVELSAKETALLENMKKIRITASTALSIRDEKQLALKQPLAKLQIVGSSEISQELLALIQSEVNVEEVEIVTSENNLNPAFTQKKTEDMVLALDTHISNDLLQKGMARELTRSVQVSRKTAGFELGELAKALIYVTTDEAKLFVERFANDIKDQTSLSDLIVERIDNIASIEGDDVKLKQGNIDLKIRLQK